MIELLMADAGENAGISNLVAIQVEYRQNHAVGRRVQEFVGMPARGERPSLRFAIADDAGNDQIGVVERCSVGMREGVAELAAFVNRTGRLRCNMAGDTTREGELGEQALHAL